MPGRMAIPRQRSPRRRRSRSRPRSRSHQRSRKRRKPFQAFQRSRIQLTSQRRIPLRSQLGPRRQSQPTPPRRTPGRRLTRSSAGSRRFQVATCACPLAARTTARSRLCGGTTWRRSEWRSTMSSARPGRSIGTSIVAAQTQGSCSFLSSTKLDLLRNQTWRRY